jgi:dienelactone hydrolase
MNRLVLAVVVLSVVVAASAVQAQSSSVAAAKAAAPPLKLTPGATFTVPFPDLPPTFYALYNKKDVPVQMTVFLPRNYDPARKHPLLVFLNGGDGGTAGNPGVARGLAEDKDFVCVSLPLFKATDPKGPGGEYIMRDPDARYTWSFYKTMLARLEELVPNLDPQRRVLGGFSNGAHATAGLIDQSDGEIARRFSAFIFVEGGGRLQHYDLLKDKPFLMAYGSEKSKPRSEEIYAAALAAGAKATLYGMNNVGHAFPASEYPAVRKWLLDVVLGTPETKVPPQAASTASAPQPAPPVPQPQVNPPASALKVRLTSPEMNADLNEGGTLVLQAEAAGSQIAKVEFFDGPKLLGSTAQPPFKLAWSPNSLPAGNYLLTARATDAAGRAAVSPAVTCTAKRRLQRTFQSYDYAEDAENMHKEVRLSIPDRLATVRGLLVVTNPAGGDTRDWYGRSWYGEFLFLHDFAFIGAKAFTSHAESYQVLADALKDFAAKSGHGELANVPFAVIGFSAGGGFASRLVNEAPDRVLASVPYSSVLRTDGAAAVLATPVCVISGDQGIDAKVADIMRPTLQSYRPQGALFSWMTLQGVGHAMVGQEVLGLPFLDAAVRLRYPAAADPRRGPVHLAALTASGGWVADNTTWKSGLTKICPAADFHGDLGQSSWLPTADLAFIYRAYSTYDNPLKIVSPAPNTGGAARLFDPGANVTIMVDDVGFPGWTKLEFFDGARKLGEAAKAAAPQFTAANLPVGLHVFSVFGTDAQGAQRSSNPVLIIVRRLPKSAALP